MNRLNEILMELMNKNKEREKEGKEIEGTMIKVTMNDMELANKIYKEVVHELRDVPAGETDKMAMMICLLLTAIMTDPNVPVSHKKAVCNAMNTVIETAIEASQQ